MSRWSKEELHKIADSDDLHIAPFRQDGATYGTPTWIWSVAVGDALFVRAYNGRKSSRYQAASEARTDHRRRHDEGSHFRGGRRANQRPHRRGVPGEVPWQPLSKSDDRRSRPLRDSQGDAERNQSMNPRKEKK